MARKKRNNTFTAPRSAAVNRNLIKQILGKWKTQRQAKITLKPFPTLSIDRVPSRNNENSNRIDVNRLQRNLYPRGQTHRGLNKNANLTPNPSPPLGGLGGLLKTPHQKNNARNALNSADNKSKPETQSLKTRDDLVCKKRPDEKKAQKGSGGSKKFVPWCK